MYANGKGVKQDYLKASKWFRKSAEQGKPEAQFNLACMYRKGRGVKEDESEAVKWYKKAADQGYEVAKFQLTLLGKILYKIFGQ